MTAGAREHLATANENLSSDVSPKMIDTYLVLLKRNNLKDSVFSIPSTYFFQMFKSEYRVKVLFKVLLVCPITLLLAIKAIRKFMYLCYIISLAYKGAPCVENVRTVSN